MKKRFNQWIEIDDFQFLQAKAKELKLTKYSVARLITLMIEFVRKNWSEFKKNL